MTPFSNLWDKKVKQLAQACVTEPELIKLLCKDNSYEPTDEEKEYLGKMCEKYKDIFGMYYISDMIWRVEHALADGRESMAVLAISETYNALNQPDYFQNIFNGNEDDEEWKTRAALRDGLNELLETCDS